MIYSLIKNSFLLNVLRIRQYEKKSSYNTLYKSSRYLDINI